MGDNPPKNNQTPKRRSGTDRTKRREITPARATLLAGYVAAAAAVVAALITAIATSVSHDAPPAVRTPTTAPARPGLAAPPSAVLARVIHTGDIGVSKFEQPTNQSGKMYGPGEGELVEVLCQVRNGQPLSDPESVPEQPNWPVWNKLKDGFFIPDLYTDLPKDPGPTPPDGLPVC